MWSTANPCAGPLTTPAVARCRRKRGLRGSVRVTRIRQGDVVIVFAVVDDSLVTTFPLGDAIETFIRREAAERFVEEVAPGSRSGSSRRAG